MGYVTPLIRPWYIYYTRENSYKPVFYCVSEAAFVNIINTISMVNHIMETSPI